MEHLPVASVSSIYYLKLKSICFYLVLDEADRILDLGFKDTMNAIVDNLPDERQTLLYSATQTK